MTQAAPRSSLRLPLVLALLVYAVLASALDFVSDDAYISFRYARNLAEGHGLVYNPGRTPPVEGYSNFLWVLWLAAFELVHADPSVVARWTSFVCGAFLIASVMRHANTCLGLSRRATFATGLFLATLPPMALWASSGLAAMPTALFVFLGYERLFGDLDRPRPVQAGLWLLAAALVRADGAVWAVLLYAGGFTYWLGALRTRRHLLAALVAGLVLTAGLALHLLWRHDYYGFWVPNTARVKAGFSTERLLRGVDYVVSWFLLLPGVLAVLLLTVRRWRGVEVRLFWLSGWILLGSLAYAVYVGGDFMPFGRFVLPAVPFVALTFAANLTHLRPPLPRLLAAACVALGAFGVFDVNVVPRSLRERFDFRPDRAFQSELERRAEMDVNTRRWLLLGRALALHTEPGESMIMGGIGAVGYETRLTLLDTYGLVTPEVLELGEVVPGASPGHDRRVQPDAFFEQQPTYLGAFLAAPGVEREERPWWAESLPASWDQHPWSKLVRVQRFPLEEALGFPPESELVLLRFHWADR